MLTDIFDAGRGKRFLAQDVVQRIENVHRTGLADLVVLEECDDKINNLLKYSIDIVAVFDTWEGPAAYVENLRTYCEVVYIPEVVANVSSTLLRGVVRIGAIGSSEGINGLLTAASVTSGVRIVALQAESQQATGSIVAKVDSIRGCETLEQLYKSVEAVYLAANTSSRKESILRALQAGKHVLCESPLSLSRADAEACFQLAFDKGLVLLESIQSAFTPAMERMTAIAQNGKIRHVLSVAVNLSVPMTDHGTQSGCQSTTSDNKKIRVHHVGETLLPVVRILHGRPVIGIDCNVIPSGSTHNPAHVCQLSIIYEGATATIMIGHGIIIPEALTVVGSEGYLTMPTPWREASKIDLQYNHINFEEASDKQSFDFPTRRGGYRFDLAEFAAVIKLGRPQSHMLTVDDQVQICALIERALACSSAGGGNNFSLVLYFID